MPYSVELAEVLIEYPNGNTYKVLQLRITSDSGKFQHLSSPTYVSVTDGTNQVSSIGSGISGDQKHLKAYFTTDAFVGFSSSSTVLLGVEDSVPSSQIPAFDPHDPILLVPYPGMPSYTDLDSITLSSL
jgi:hypothetical protein